MMNFIAPAKRKRRAVAVCAVQSRRFRFLWLEFDMVCSPVVFERLPAPELFGVASASHYCVERIQPKSTSAQKETDLFFASSNFRSA
jgi:hypothetical protein